MQRRLCFAHCDSGRALRLVYSQRITWPRDKFPARDAARNDEEQ